MKDLCSLRFCKQTALVNLLMAAINCDVLSSPLAHLSLYSRLESYTSHIARGFVVTMTVLTFLTVLTLDDIRTLRTAQSPTVIMSGVRGVSFVRTLNIVRSEEGTGSNLAPPAFLLAPKCTGPCPHTHFYDRSMNLKARGNDDNV